MALKVGYMTYGRLLFQAAQTENPELSHRLFGAPHGLFEMIVDADHSQGSHLKRFVHLISLTSDVSDPLYISDITKGCIKDEGNYPVTS